MNTATITTAWDRVRPLGTVTYRQFDYWIRRGWVHVDTPTGLGSGHARTISTHELAVVAEMGRLASLGLGPDVSARVGRDLASQGWSVLDGIRIEAAA